MERVKSSMDFRLYPDRTLCIVGPSQSGKTSFVMKLLDHRHELFHSPQPRRVVWCYGIYQAELHNQLRSKGYLLHSGLMQSQDLQPNDIIILDDLLNESESSADVTSMFTRAAHHKPCFVIFITQNLYPRGKDARTRSLNTHYYVLMKNPRDKAQVNILAHQMVPRQAKAFVESFEDATQEAHSYLFVDLTQECLETHRIRARLFDSPMIIYQLQH